MEPEGIWKFPDVGCVYDTTTIRTPQAQLKMGQGLGHPAVAVWGRVSDSFVHLDLAIETIIQDIDFVFVCSPRLSSKHFDPCGNKRHLCSNIKRFHGISLDISIPFPPFRPSLNLSVPWIHNPLRLQNCIWRELEITKQTITSMYWAYVSSIISSSQGPYEEGPIIFSLLHMKNQLSTFSHFSSSHSQWIEEWDSNPGLAPEAVHPIWTKTVDIFMKSYFFYFL